MSAQRPTPPTDNQWARALWAEGAGYMLKQQSALTVTLNLIISGLTSIILIVLSTINLQFPHSSVSKEFACSAGDLGSIPGSGRFPWRRKWQPTPVFLPEESHGRRSLAGYSPWGRKELDTTERLHLYTYMRRAWQPTPVSLPGKSHTQRSLVGYNPQVAKSRTLLSDFTFTFM